MTEPKKIVLLGATGSIGTSTLQVLRKHPDRLQLIGISANSNSQKLTEIVPLYKDSTSNLLLPSTQFDMYSAENVGLIKFDFLGLKTLTVINNTQ